MKTIWKEKLVPVEGKPSLFPLELPKGAKIQDTYESEKGLQVMRWTK